MVDLRQRNKGLIDGLKTKMDDGLPDNVMVLSWEYHHHHYLQLHVLEEITHAFESSLLFRYKNVYVMDPSKAAHQNPTNVSVQILSVLNLVIFEPGRIKEEFITGFLTLSPLRYLRNAVIHGMDSYTISPQCCYLHKREFISHLPRVGG